LSSEEQPFADLPEALVEEMLKIYMPLSKKMKIQFGLIVLSTNLLNFG
jgi:hypothetical protein